MDSETIEVSKEPTVAKVEHSIAHQPQKKNEAKRENIQQSSHKPSVRVAKARVIKTEIMAEEKHTESIGYEPSVSEFNDFNTDEFICINLDKMKHESNDTRSAMASMNNELLSLE